ncbi:MAG: UDP-N-acetylmuramate dehydrogenase [Candidatus Falkowbacteria bacterium]
MIVIEKKVLLANHTTLRIGGFARYYVEVREKNELLDALIWAKKKRQAVFVLGGGSNTFFADGGFSGLVIKNKVQGISVIRESDTHVWIEAGGGEWWAALANYCLLNKYYGLENLCLIPGSVGAAPMQNIGAYGVELKDVFVSLTAVNLKTLKEQTFHLDDCKFAYRDSIFKNKLKGKYFIYSITVRLSKKPVFNFSFPELAEKFANREHVDITGRDVVAAITAIRNSKLPIPAIVPNAGSFFKNVELNQKDFATFLKKFPDAKYTIVNNRHRIFTGWLIEQCGFKGTMLGPVGVYEKQALILINTGGGNAKELMRLAKKIMSAVKKKFGLELEMEVNFVK